MTPYPPSPLSIQHTMSDSITPAQVRAALADCNDPESGRPLAEMDQLHAVEASAEGLRVVVGLTTHSAILWNATRGRIEERLRSQFPGIASVTVEVETHQRPPVK